MHVRAAVYACARCYVHAVLCECACCYAHAALLSGRFVGTIASSAMKALGLKRVAEDFNEKHMGGWQTMCQAAGIGHTTLTPYIDVRGAHPPSPPPSIAPTLHCPHPPSPPPSALRPHPHPSALTFQPSPFSPQPPAPSPQPSALTPHPLAPEPRSPPPSAVEPCPCPCPCPCPYPNPSPHQASLSPPRSPIALIARHGREASRLKTLIVSRDRVRGRLNSSPTTTSQ